MTILSYQKNDKSVDHATMVNAPAISLSLPEITEMLGYVANVWNTAEEPDANGTFENTYAFLKNKGFNMWQVENYIANSTRFGTESEFAAAAPVAVEAHQASHTVQYCDRCFVTRKRKEPLGFCDCHKNPVIA